PDRRPCPGAPGTSRQAGSAAARPAAARQLFVARPAAQPRGELRGGRDARPGDRERPRALRRLPGQAAQPAHAPTLARPAPLAEPVALTPAHAAARPAIMRPCLPPGTSAPRPTGKAP